MLQLPETNRRRTVGAADPIFRAIASHKSLKDAADKIYDEHEEAQHNAMQEIGHRPTPLIHWRGYTIGNREIENRRDALLQAGELDAAAVEAEYLDARARYKAQLDGGKAWDKRAGLVAMGKQLDRATMALGRSTKRLSTTAPTTPAGAGALLQFILDDDLCADEGYWHVKALETLAEALNTMADTSPHRA